MFETYLLIFEHSTLLFLKFWFGIILTSSLIIALILLNKNKQKTKALSGNTHKKITTNKQKSLKSRSYKNNTIKRTNNKTNKLPKTSDKKKKKDIENNESSKTAITSKKVALNSKPKIPKTYSKPKRKLTESILENDKLDKLIDDILFVNYTSSIPEQTHAYPVFRYPNYGSVVKSYRIGATKRRGYKEESFQQSIEKFFGNRFIVSGELRINTGETTRPFEPDIALIDKRNKSLKIDIEIDEPYAGISRQPTHCEGEDNLRDDYFVDRGWIVIRFSEYQVHVFEKECLKFICKVIQGIIPSFSIPSELRNVNVVENENFWDRIQAQKWEKAKYREKYLNHEFKPIEESIETIERGLNEQELMEESLVTPTLIGKIEKRPLSGFNITNFNPRDQRIKFYPESHVYTIDNIPAPSVSTIISNYFPKFDAEYWAKRKAFEYGKTTNEIITEWEERRREAAKKGSFLHEQIEKFYLNLDYDRTEEFYLFEQFIKDHPNLEPFRSEWRIFDEEFHIAGTIDLISKNNKKYDIYDWKRSKKVIDPITEKPIILNPWQSGIGMLSDIDDTNYNKYCLQQSLYRYILEKNYDLSISKMYLVILHPEYDKYYKVSVPYLKDKVEYILKNHHIN